MDKESNYSKPMRYTILAHTFNTFEEACEYMNQITSKGTCHINPLIKAWNKGVVVAQWIVTVTQEGVIYKSDFK